MIFDIFCKDTTVFSFDNNYSATFLYNFVCNILLLCLLNSFLIILEPLQKYAQLFFPLPIPTESYRILRKFTDSYRILRIPTDWGAVYRPWNGKRTDKCRRQKTKQGMAAVWVGEGLLGG